MNINSTLFVQAVNFFIAYLLFRFVLLKPAYKTIEQEDQHYKSLEELVMQDQALLEEVKQKQIDQWQACRDYCKNYVPEIYKRAILFRGIGPKIAYAPVSEQELRVLKTNLIKAIISRTGVCDGK